MAGRSILTTMKASKFEPKKTADGWMLSIPPALSDNGKRQRKFFTSKDKAEREAAPLREKFRSGKAGNILPPVQHRAALEAFRILGERDPLELIAAVKELLEKSDHAAKSITFRESCEKFRAAKDKQHLTSKYLLNFKHYPERFTSIADKLLVEISTADLERELAALPPYAKNTAAAHLSSLWSFAIPKEWARVNPVDNVARAHAPKPTIPILTAKQLRRLFVSTIRLYPDMIPLIAVEVFAGIRPVESEKLRWENIDFAEGILDIPDEIAKTRIGRHITMHPTLISWLNWHIESGGANTGKICPPLPKRTKENPRKSKKAPPADPEEHSPQILRQRLREIRNRAGITPWPQDVLRHTFASAAIASKWRDIGHLCLELGHSSQKMLSRHYLRTSMRAKEGKAVFAVTPPTAKSKIRRFQAA